MGIIEAWATALSNADLLHLVVTSLVFGAVILVLSLAYVLSCLQDARDTRIELAKTEEAMAKQLVQWQDMLVATKFLTLNPEVFADEHKESKS